MNDQREQIERALEKLDRRKRALDFQYLAIALFGGQFPFLQAAEWNHDGGEDAFTLPTTLPNRQKVSFACSLTATLAKVRQDCGRIRARNVDIDLLIFITRGRVERVTADNWKKE